ncbi:MAG: S41 family peptidase [Candidatus Kapabacteria bacterium]|nr:S41 family peptidase [Candidatus Kapabacteria bacterium]
MKKYLIVTGAIILGVLIGFFIQPLVSGDSIFDQVRKFDYVLNTAAKNYVEEVDTQKLTEAAIKAALNELDVHSVYIPAEEMKRVNEDFQGSFEGIGIEFDIINDTITIVTPIPGGPSEMLGLMSGDKIIKIDDENAVGLSRSEVPKKLKGPKGTKVKVEIVRPNQKETLKFTITRDKIPINTVDAAYIIDNTDIGVIVVNRFAATTHDELVDALNNLSAQGMKKLILDLRGNPGGFLNQAVLMADEFLNKGDTIVYTIGRKNRFDESYISTGGSKFKNLPLIVLINAGSASASEIVSGAIQDLDRGLIVGETSYGKGLVQRQYEIGDGSAFRLTISKYYTPSGRSIQRPYKDKDKYRHLVGRLELEEGSYLENAKEKIIQQVNEINKKAKKDDEKIDINNLPIYKTKRGRTVFGGGGITPDYIIKQDTITRFSAEIRRKNLFFEFATGIMQSQGSSIKSKYASDFTSFLKNYQITDAMLEDFKKLAVSKEIEWDNEAYKIDEEFIKISIKSAIARMIWDRNKFLEVFYTIDPQIKKAIELFPEAIKIARLK